MTEGDRANTPAGYREQLIDLISEVRECSVPHLVIETVLTRISLLVVYFIREKYIQYIFSY